MVDQLALGQRFVLLLWLYLVSIIPPILHTHYFVSHRHCVADRVNCKSCSKNYTYRVLVGGGGSRKETDHLKDLGVDGRINMAHGRKKLCTYVDIVSDFRIP